MSIHSNILEEQRHQIERLDGAVQRLSQEHGYVFEALRELKNEMQSRPQPRQADAPDANEIDILTEQLQNVAAKANEVDSLKVEVNIMRRQIRRLDRHASPVPSGLPSVEPTSHSHSHAPPPPPQHAGTPAQVAAFAVGTPSGSESRSILHQTPTENRLPPPILSTAEHRPSSDQHAPAESRILPSFRSIDPATSSVSSWRPAGSFTPAPPTSAPPSGVAIAPTPQPEAPVVSGWAAVNANAAPKRNTPGEGHASAFESSQRGSPKRQRLAPLMPRVNYNEQSSNGASSPHQHSGATPDSLPPVPSLANSRNPSNESRGSLPPPANPLRFVLSTQDAPSEDSWRPESQRVASEAARGGGPRGGSPPHGGRGGAGAARGRGHGHNSGGPDEYGTPEWERPEWTGSQIQPNGYCQPGAIPSAQDLANRGNLVCRSGGVVGGPSDRPPMPSISTPDMHVAPQSGMYPDPHFMSTTTSSDSAVPTISNSSGQPTKKTRTKPIRNADGVLIRKDGRPDMRSVSSAMNLKKVHAKKEAERQSKETSVDDNNRSGMLGTPGSNSERGAGSPRLPSARYETAGEEESDSEGEEDEEGNVSTTTADGASTQDKHAANMRKIFPYGIDGGPQAARNMAQAFFPPINEFKAAPPVSKVETPSAERPVVASREKTATATDNVTGGERPADGVGAGEKEEKRDVEMTDGA